MRERGARAGAVRKAHLTATTVQIANMGIHIHTRACLPLAYDSSWRSTHGGSKSCSVGTSVEAVVSALFSVPLVGELCDLRLAHKVNLP